jgi:hypothetical protein
LPFPSDKGMGAFENIIIAFTSLGGIGIFLIGIACIVRLRQRQYQQPETIIQMQTLQGSTAR